MEEYWSHSARVGTSIKHGLEEHLESTARLAQMFAKSYDPEGLASIAGLLHDVGKYYHEFQRYLEDPTYKRTYCDHASAGAVYAVGHFPSEQAFVLAMLIFSHHTGLIDSRKWVRKIKEKREQPFVQEALGRAKPYLERYSDLFQRKRVPYFDRNNIDPVNLEMKIRMLFSALVDADFLDTERHFSPEKASMRSDYLMPCDLYRQLEVYYSRLTQDESSKKPINQTRTEIFQECVKKAERNHSFYLLNVPTGLGKTSSSIGFALKHAEATQKQRVIVTLPFTSIIDQNAAEYQKIFGKDHVLEHHSLVDWKVAKQIQDKKFKLAAENWDMPIVVTSTVQLFESLFAKRTSAVRKLHNIANSVIVMDEFQMLPLELLEPIFSTMEELMKNYQVTFIACSATPLSFEWRKYFEKVGKPISIIEDSERLFQENQRVTFNWLKDSITWDELSAKGVKRERQALFIVNTKKDARNLYQSLRKEKKGSVYHLSTMMCSKHRQTILDIVKQKLSNDDCVYLVSTQLIEAGVDIDFPVIYRALAPLDSLIQAAGRCNREGRLQKGEVFIFEPSEGGLPSNSYKTAIDQTKITLRGKWDELHLPQTYHDYFQELYHLDGQRLDQKGVQQERMSTNWNFPKMAQDFQMIEEDTVAVVCPYDEKGQKLIDFVINHSPNRQWYREVQLYVVNIRRCDPIFKEQPKSFVAITDNWFVLKANSIYDPSFGLNPTMIYSASDLSV